MGADEPGRGWQPLTSVSSDAEALAALEDAIVRVRFAPQNQELRRRLRGLVALPRLREPSVPVLVAEVRKALTDEPEAAAVFLELLVRTFETLDRPVEAVAAMEQLVALAPDNVEHLSALAARCVNLGAWTKAAEAFERIGAVGSNDHACGALRAAANLYCKNTQLDRAVAAYRAIIARRPGDKEAWHALEQLLEQLGHWRELAEVRGELAKRAPSAVDKARLLRGQARALEAAGDGDGAADAMAQAARYMPDDIAGMLELADVLARTGRGSESADLLAKRVDDAVARHASPEEVAGLRLRLAAVLEDSCGDRAAATSVLDRLLAEHPTYVPALERLAAQAAQQPDPNVHAAALERLAAAVEEPGAKAAILVDAARRYLDARDRGAAASVFQQASELVPDDVALRDELTAVLATIDVERAIAEASAGDPASAEQRLRNILGMRPHDVDANLALADILVATNQLAAAREHLQHTLATASDDMPKRQLAPLAFKYALVIEATGDGDEAHRLLHEAHLLDRHSLVITLALGHSCIARKLWRQAVLYLAPLAEHPDVQRHAAAVAAGLVQAGHAEVRALRPANAMKHFEAAVRLDPNCPSAWHALAEDAMERGDRERAIEYFEREASGMTNPSARARLLDALGDLAHDVLRDSARAEAYWKKIDHPDASILRKVLAVQRARGADVERAETCMRLAAVDAAGFKELMTEAADGFAQVGDFVRARLAAERLIAAHPLDVDAVNCASSVLLAACDADTAAAWLQRALEAWTASRTDEPRQAELWRRLGDADRSRKRNREAKAAYERTIAIAAPGSPDAVAARRALMELTPKTARTIDSLELLVEAEQSPEEVLALARDLVVADRVEDARTVFDLARAIEAPLTAADDELLARTAPRRIGYDEAYGTTLDEATRHEVLDDAEVMPLAAVLDIVGEALSLVAPDPTTALRRAGIADPVRLSATSYAAVAGMYPQVSKALGGPQTLSFTSDALADQVRVVLASPPVIVFGAGVAAVRGVDVDESSDPLLRFKLGRSVELCRPRRLLAAGIDADSFARFLEGLALACGPQSASASSTEEAKRLHSALSIPLRRRIGELLPQMPRDALDPHAYIAACERAADRAGLVACGNARVAIAASSQPASLIRYAASRRYRLARRRLRMRGR